jgi:hypothetical protein
MGSGAACLNEGDPWAKVRSASSDYTSAWTRCEFIEPVLRVHGESVLD